MQTTKLTNDGKSDIGVNVAVAVADVALKHGRICFGHSDVMNDVIVHHATPAHRNPI